MLRIEGLSAGYGAVQALSDITVEVPDDGFVAVVGPNGAGKTTLFKTISGTVAARAGKITYDGQDLLAVPPAGRPRLGIAHVPEGRQVFRTLTVEENLATGSYATTDQAGSKRALERVFTLFPRLAERRSQLAGTLSGGEQQMLAIGRGLVSVPKLLLLDEPSMGLAPAIVDSIFETIQAIHAEYGLAILLVEQRVAEALQNCTHAYVIETGRVVLEGKPEVLMRDDRIKRAYLGM
jgi:branched-chain amino acid transport system ATP-binding protein